MAIRIMDDAMTLEIDNRVVATVGANLAHRVNHGPRGAPGQCLVGPALVGLT
jgi:hypothetical protein